MMTIIVDAREQTPFLFDWAPSVNIERTALKTGDYSIKGMERRICIERKSISDLFNSCGTSRKRFQEEMKRMIGFEYAAIVCEADLYSIVRTPPGRSRLKPKSLLASLIAWQCRYNVHFWPCANRDMAERITYRILERFYKDDLTEQKKNSHAMRG